MGKIAELFRPLLVKYVLRGILWVLITVLGMDAATAQEPATQLAAGVAAVVLAVVAFLLDRWNHKKDLATVPPTAPHDGAQL